METKTEKVAQILRDILDLFKLTAGFQEDAGGFSLDGGVLKISSKELVAPVDLWPRLYGRVSPLEDNFVDSIKLKSFISELKGRGALTSLNHVGFCYQTPQPENEKTVILKELKNSTYNLYEEESCDKSLWLFIGTDNWQAPMIELLPVGKIRDPWLDLWLPHIHLDFDTKEKAEDLDKLVLKYFEGDPVPFHAVVIDSYIHVVRVRLGVVDGINFTLDFATNRRRQNYRRAHLLKKLS